MLKMVTIGFLILILLIPENMVESLIQERSFAREGVIAEVSSKWGNEQTLTGPILTIPYTVFLNQNGQQIPFKAILEKHKGQTILIDVWASWCKDCLECLPSIKKIQSENKDVVYLFLSLDKTEKQWKNGIKMHQISGEHYFINSGWDGPFNVFLKL